MQDYNAVMILAAVLNPAARAIMEVFLSEGYISKELELEDVIGRKLKN